jgi:hypothetical protein
MEKAIEYWLCENDINSIFMKEIKSNENIQFNTKYSLKPYNKEELFEFHIHNIVNYHMNEMKISTYTTEYSVVNNPNNTIYPIYKKEGDEVIYPLLSCMVFLTDSNIPFVMTDIDINNYKYKEFKRQTRLNLIFPQKNTHVVFDGKKCNGFINTIDNTNNTSIIAIAINVWKNEIETFNESTIVFKSIQPNSVERENILNYHLFNTLLYKQKYTMNDVKTLMELSRDTHKWFSIQNKKLVKQNSVLNVNNKFMQRFHIKNFINENTCHFLLENMENEWQTNDNKTFPSTYIKLMNCNKLTEFSNSLLKSVCDEMNKSYNIEKVNSEITHALFCKYDKYSTNQLEMYSVNERNITVEIMLNKNRNKHRVLFADELNTILEEGDLLIYSNVINHSISPIEDDSIYYKIVLYIRFL